MKSWLGKIMAGKNLLVENSVYAGFQSIQAGPAGFR